VQIGCIKPLCELLVCSDVRIVTVALEGLENILKVPAVCPLPLLAVHDVVLPSANPQRPTLHLR
jgi:Armadillo/beta-catenin-like repeat